MKVVRRIDDSTVCAGRKSGIARGSDNARPKAAEIVSIGAKE
jgi:hypothetical protein